MAIFKFMLPLSEDILLPKNIKIITPEMCITICMFIERVVLKEILYSIG